MDIDCIPFLRMRHCGLSVSPSVSEEPSACRLISESFQSTHQNIKRFLLCVYVCPPSYSGDHLQLRPKAEVYRLTKESRNGYDLDVSMFERVRAYLMQHDEITESSVRLI